MVEIFKTDVQELEQAEKVLSLLLHRFPLSKINFDLDDCDRILRVEGESVASEEILLLVRDHGHQCYILE